MARDLLDNDVQEIVREKQLKAADVALYALLFKLFARMSVRMSARVCLDFAGRRRS